MLADIVHLAWFPSPKALGDTDFPQDRSIVSDGRTRYPGKMKVFATNKLVHV
jgi:hypothetical protein